MNNFLKIFIITTTAFLMLLAVIPSALMQEADNMDDVDIGEAMEVALDNEITSITSQDMEDIMNQLDVYHSGFLVVRDEFFADQSEGNKVRYHKAGLDWAVHLVEANLQYIDHIQVDLYSKLKNKNNLSADWLQIDRDLLVEYIEKINNSNDYVELRAIMTDYTQDWEVVKQKIDNIKVLIAIDEWISLVIDARMIYNNLDIQKQSIVSALDSLELEAVDTSAFEQVFVTYGESLLKTELIIPEVVGDINNLRSFSSFDDEDEEWQNVITGIDDIKSELKILSVLQENSILQFINILNTTIQPANKPLP